MKASGPPPVKMKNVTKDKWPPLGQMSSKWPPPGQMKKMSPTKWRDGVGANLLRKKAQNASATFTQKGAKNEGG